MPNKTRIAKLTRVRHHEDHETVYFTMPANVRARLLDYIDKEAVPEFEGEEAWFLMERVPAVPWSYWRVVRAVEPPDRT